MEKRRNGIDRQPSRRCRDHPSFSSTLLDAIYRSIDETDSRGVTKEQRTGGAPDRVSAKKQNNHTPCESRRNAPPVTLPPRAATSSSSDGSSYGGFSSSDTESAYTPHLRPIRTAPPARPVRFRPENPPVQFVSSGIDENRSKKERRGSIRSCLRDLKNGGSPSSPGARLAHFLSSIFAAKSKVSAESSCTRSCLSKTPSSEKRTVRFCPVSVIVGEDCRPSGEKWVYGAAGDPPASAAPVRRTKVEEEEEEEEDLFELKNLAVIGRFRDELPVYETTRLGKYGGVSRGLII